MSRIIYLTTEDRMDANVIRAFIRAKQLLFEIKESELQVRGINQLAAQLGNIIKSFLKERRAGDCIAVLHDADALTQTDRTRYDQIRQVCDRYREDVFLVIARDELEAWLLADEGLCDWLGEKPGNKDEMKRPSDRLKSLAKAKMNRDYGQRTQEQVLKHLNGTADKHSPSFQQALAHLNNAACTRKHPSSPADDQR